MMYRAWSVGGLHHNAMLLAQAAMVARQKGGTEEAEHLSREALEYEMRAAERVPREHTSEPTRSILYLSAATLARDCKEFATVKKLVNEGLLGEPSAYAREGFEELLNGVRRESDTP